MVQFIDQTIPFEALKNNLYKLTIIYKLPSKVGLIRNRHNALPFLGYALLKGSIIKGFLASDLSRVKASKEIIGICNFWLPRISQNV